MATTEQKKAPAAKAKQPPTPQRWTVRVVTMVPAEVTYAITAVSEEEALKLVGKTKPTGFRPNLTQQRISRATVYRSGSSVICLTRTYR